jgi:hypothetical protein
MEQISAHWRGMLEHFDGSLATLRGVTKVRSRAATPLHWLMQRPYIRMGADLPRLDRFLAAGRAVAKRQRRAFDLDMLRQSLTLAFCDKHGAIAANQHYVVIGDGYGALSSMIVEAVPGATVTMVNIEPVLDVDRRFFLLAHPEAKATFLRAEDADKMDACFTSFDLACMGEINPDVRDRYCALRCERSQFIYSCNRVSKTFADGTTSSFADYGWTLGRIIVHEPCPWHQTFYTRSPPFIRAYDGPFEHKLIATR